MVFGDATMYAHVGIVHGGVCAFTWGTKIATAEKDSSRIKAALYRVLDWFFFIFSLLIIFLENVLLYACHWYIILT
jgi:hypothetical protein